jgi:hypothetical protein
MTAIFCDIYLFSISTLFLIPRRLGTEKNCKKLATVDKGLRKWRSMSLVSLFLLAFGATLLPFAYSPNMLGLG